MAQDIRKLARRTIVVKLPQEIVDQMAQELGIDNINNVPQEIVVTAVSKDLVNSLTLQPGTLIGQLVTVR